MTPLHYATLHRSLNCIKILLAQGADIHACTCTPSPMSSYSLSPCSLTTPFLLACSIGYYEGVKLLAQGGSALSAVDSEGNDAFMLIERARGRIGGKGVFEDARTIDLVGSKGNDAFLCLEEERAEIDQCGGGGAEENKNKREGRELENEEERIWECEEITAFLLGCGLEKRETINKHKASLPKDTECLYTNLPEQLEWTDPPF